LRDALIISLVFHVVIITVGMLGLPMFSREKPTQMKVIPVEMISIGEVTKLVAQEKKPDPATKKMPPKKKTPERKVEMPPPPPKLASNMPLPDMATKPKKVKKKAEPKKTAPEMANRAPKITPKKKPSRFNSGKLSALLDKREEAQPNILELLKDKKFGEEKVISMVDVRQQTLSIIDAVGQHIFNNQCWNIPAGAKGAEGLVVTIQARLSPDGKLIGSPKVLESRRMTMPGQEFFRTAAESALRAVRKCAPYDFLPKEQYNLWRELDIVFDPEYAISG